MIAATIASVLLILDGLILQPWSAFAPPTSNDPDEAYWLVRMRIASVAWVLLIAIATGCITTVIRRRRFKRRPEWRQRETL